MLFSIYMLPLGQIFRKYNICFHSYADDTQIYLQLKGNSPASLEPLLQCLGEVKSWMASNSLHFNENKTEVIIFGPSGNPNTSNFNLHSFEPFVKSHAKNLGVILDSNFTFEKQISSVVQRSFFKLRLLSKVRSFLSFKNFERAIHAFIISQLDYCNSLYAGVSQTCLARLQLVQNAAAHLLTRTKRCEHISPVLASLHWLPVRFRINFKILLLTYKALNGQAPGYLSDLLQTYTPLRSLRSSDLLLLAVPRSRLVHRGDRAFAVVAPKLWNNLPLHIRQAPTVNLFKSYLKTHFYLLAFNTA